MGGGGGGGEEGGGRRDAAESRQVQQYAIFFSQVLIHDATFQCQGHVCAPGKKMKKNAFAARGAEFKMQIMPDFCQQARKTVTDAATARHGRRPT